jgi:uncharacterized membrane protein
MRSGVDVFIVSGSVAAIVPGSFLTAANGINTTGQIVGNFSKATGGHGFLDTGGSFTTIDVPGSSLTSAFGINAKGQIVGLFENATRTHGFLATPVPAPDTLLLVGTGLAFGTAWKRIRKRSGAVLAALDPLAPGE